MAKGITLGMKGGGVDSNVSEVVLHLKHWEYMWKIMVFLFETIT